ncbi:hypothetical protein B0J11DRAFT_510360 [Dendryphion nanum]|uniref:Uncharacterized protein n=1 Tax=Dendryphion nanum TaxID=256645 RepID=A0A9P9ICR0_9PLEO|nr:hypothetical protein B0J11DRAFT_510360 [Dendryphion nanum]
MGFFRKWLKAIFGPQPTAPPYLPDNPPPYHAISEDSENNSIQICSNLDEDLEIGPSISCINLQDEAASPIRSSSQTLPILMTPENRLGENPYGKKDEAIAKLQKSLIEILAITLSAEIGPINQLLGGQANTSSILCDNEKKTLVRLGLTIIHLNEMYLKNEWNLTLDADRNAVKYAIINPSINTHRRPHMGFILDLIATYAECNRSKEEHTIISRCASLHTRFQYGSSYRQCDTPKDLNNTFLALAKTINWISPSEGVRHILGRALVDTQEIWNRDLKGIKGTISSISYPTRPGLYDLSLALV